MFEVITEGECLVENFIHHHNTVIQYTVHLDWWMGKWRPDSVLNLTDNSSVSP